MFFAPNPPHVATTRLTILAARSGRAVWTDVLLLLAFGVGAAALTLFVDLGIRVPGHAILRAVVPIALGIAVVPRRHAGTVAGVGAFGGAVAMGGWPSPVGVGALTSLTLTGPILDLALRRARTGPAVYVGLVLGGLASNGVAFLFRLVPKLLGEVGHRPLAEWWPRAVVSYSLCGAAAGLVSAALWFKLRARATESE